MGSWDGLRNVCWVGLGGFLGANARYLLGTAIQARIGRFSAWPTFWINVSGSFALGFLLSLLEQKSEGRGQELRLLLGVGFLGAYTTFSTFSYETWLLITHGRWLAALGNALGSTAAGLLACLLGVVAARTVAP